MNQERSFQNTQAKFLPGFSGLKQEDKIMAVDYPSTAPSKGGSQ